MRSNEEIDMKRIGKKKLELDTETIRRLAGADLAAAVGGSFSGSSGPCPSNLLCTYSQACPPPPSGACGGGGSHAGGPPVGGHNLE
jgi:hypothetical protein